MAKAKLKCTLQPRTQPNCSSTALFLLRLIAGMAFVFHGWGMIQNPMDWMGPQAPVPGIFQFLAALSEFGGGIAWVLGLLAPLASLGIFCTMIVAVYMHLIVRHDPFVGSGGPSYELALVYLGIAALIFTLGPGKFSLDTKIFGERK